MYNSIVKVSSDKSFLGTGFVIESDNKGSYILTCGHVINQESTIFVDDKKAKIIKNMYGEDLDLAIVYVEGMFLPPLELCDKAHSDSGFVIGYTRLNQDVKKEKIPNVKIRSDVFIEKKSRNTENIKLFTNEEISPGYSGSPVICTTTNQVVGVVTLKQGESINYAISYKHIKEIHRVTTNSIKPFIFNKVKISTAKDDNQYYVIEQKFIERHVNSLQCYSSNINIWVEPKVYKLPESNKNRSKSNLTIEIDEIILKPRSIILNTHQQFGATSLAHYLVKEAWQGSVRSLWLYLDFESLKPHRREILKVIDKSLNSLGLNQEDVECVVLDNFNSYEVNTEKTLVILGEIFDKKPLVIIKSTINESITEVEFNYCSIRDFENLYIWSLARSEIRSIVSKYNDKQYISNEDMIVSRITQDLEVLNIPRTALNCLTLLKTYEAEFEESPINRTEMIKRVLFLLFNIENIPHYKSKPDLKDVEYILGYFCEIMIISEEYVFSREGFLDSISDFCSESEIDIEITLIFDILYSNNIIICYKGSDSKFVFRYTYWLYYFAAHRMHHSNSFSSHILEGSTYTSFPEIIEFYTGIDRRRDNALLVLTSDMKEIREIVSNKCQLPKGFDLYKMLSWNPSSESLNNVIDEMSQSVKESNLPCELKDQYADKQYDCVRPMKQSINKVLDEYHLVRLIKITHASCKALRNSDYSEPIVRHQLLNEILLSWEQIIVVLQIFAPVIAKSKTVNIDGANIVLIGTDTLTPQESMMAYITNLPASIVGRFMDDLFSTKMGPLLYKKSNSSSHLISHLLNSLIALKRPNKWEECIGIYINSLDKNSYFLNDIFNTLRSEYKYSFTSQKNINNIGKLIKTTAAKHHLGIKNVKSKDLNKANKYLPTRDVKGIEK